MSLDHLPANIEEGVQRFAEQMHLSHDEALFELIRAGLRASKATTAVPQEGPGVKPGELLIGLFSSPEGGAIFEEAMILSRHLRETERLRNVWQ